VRGSSRRARLVQRVRTLLVVREPFLGSFVGHSVKEVAFEKPHSAVLGLAQTSRRGEDLVEHGLQTLGPGDRPQDVSHRAPLFLEFLDLSGEPVFGL
jgi:hypothetical protein